MEHNIEKLLQEKILIAERAPVSWRKAATWERIQTQVPQGKRLPAFYYYAAASVLVVGLVTAGLLFRSSPKSHPAVETSHTDVPVPKSIQSIEECPSPVAVAESGKVPHNKTLRAVDKKLVSTVVAPATLVDSLAAEESISTNTVAAIIQVSTEPPKETTTRKVRPIIGVVVEQPLAPVIITKNKQHKIKIFPRDEDGPLLYAPEPTTLTARIN